MSATLHINRSETNCAECGAECSMSAAVCPRCGQTFTHIGTGYMGLDNLAIARIRPDLEPNFHEPLSEDDLRTLRHEIDGPQPNETRREHGN